MLMRLYHTRYTEHRRRRDNPRAVGIDVHEPDMQISRIRLSDKTSRLSTARRAQAGSDVRARSARRGARVDSSRRCIA